jgi:hypothetical protein
MIFTTPTALVAEVVIAVALLLALALVLLHSARDTSIPRVATASYFQRLIADEKRFAAHIGMTHQTWFAVRLFFFALCALFGIVSGIPLLYVLGLAVGVFALKWMMTPRISRRQLDVERLFLNEIKLMRNRSFDRGLSLDMSIHEMASNCDPMLKHIMAPLLEDRPLDQRLVEVSERAHSPLISQICSSLIVVRTRDPQALRSVLDQNLIPLGEGQQEVGGKAHALLTTQHSYMRFLIILMLAFLLMSQRVSSFHQFYVSFVGQAFLIVDIVIFVGIMFFMSKSLQVPKGYYVNVREVANRLGGSGS